MSFFTKQATLTKKSTVLRIPLQLVFPCTYMVLKTGFVIFEKSVIPHTLTKTVDPALAQDFIGELIRG